MILAHRAMLLLRLLAQALLEEGDPCPDLEPGTVDWHTLKPTDPYPNGGSGERVFCPAPGSAAATEVFPPGADARFRSVARFS